MTLLGLRAELDGKLLVRDYLLLLLIEMTLGSAVADAARKAIKDADEQILQFVEEHKHDQS